LIYLGTMARNVSLVYKMKKKEKKSSFDTMEMEIRTCT